MARIDRGILFVVIALIGIGLVQVYSSSYILAIDTRGDGLYFFKRQVVFAVLSIGLLFLIANIPFKLIEKFGWILWPLAAFGVALSLTSLGVRAGGAARWIRVPTLGVFEPGELIKISLPLLLATYFSRRSDFLGSYQFLFRTLLLFTPFILLLRQPDFGTFMICFLVFVGVLFAFGLNWKILATGIAVSLPAFYFLVMKVPYRRARITAFLDPWSDPAQKGFQVIQSMLSFKNGGLFGVGLGQGQGKLMFLPEAHTDFTLAVLGEEVGFVGVVALMCLYGFLIFRGLQISVNVRAPFAKVLALGLTLTFALSVLTNAGVVMGLLPTKGLTLPFLSSGGSSLIMTCLLFGLLLNLDKSDRMTSSRWN